MKKSIERKIYEEYLIEEIASDVIEANEINKVTFYDCFDQSVRIEICEEYLKESNSKNDFLIEMQKIVEYAYKCGLYDKGDKNG